MVLIDAPRKSAKYASLQNVLLLHRRFVSNAINSVGMIIRNQHGAIVQHRNTNRTAIYFGLVFAGNKAGEKIFGLAGLTIAERNEHHFVAGENGTVP